MSSTNIKKDAKTDNKITIKNPTLFKTGFLNDSSKFNYIRLNQGLSLQHISNQCQNIQPNIEKIYPSCENKYMYPFYTVPYNNGKNIINDSCGCTKYIKAP